MPLKDRKSIVHQQRQLGDQGSTSATKCGIDRKLAHRMVDLQTGHVIAGICHRSEVEESPGHETSSPLIVSHCSFLPVHDGFEDSWGSLRNALNVILVDGSCL